MKNTSGLVDYSRLSDEELSEMCERRPDPNKDLYLKMESIKECVRKGLPLPDSLPDWIKDRYDVEELGDLLYRIELAIEREKEERQGNNPERRKAKYKLGDFVRIETGRGEPVEGILERVFFMGDEMGTFHLDGELYSSSTYWPHVKIPRNEKGLIVNQIINQDFERDE